MTYNCNAQYLQNAIVVTNNQNNYTPNTTFCTTVLSGSTTRVSLGRFTDGMDFGTVSNPLVLNTVDGGVSGTFMLFSTPDGQTQSVKALPEVINAQITSDENAVYILLHKASTDAFDADFGVGTTMTGTGSVFIGAYSHNGDLLWQMTEFTSTINDRINSIQVFNDKLFVAGDVTHAYDEIYDLDPSSGVEAHQTSGYGSCFIQVFEKSTGNYNYGYLSDNEYGTGRTDDLIVLPNGKAILLFKIGAIVNGSSELRAFDGIDAIGNFEFGLSSSDASFQFQTLNYLPTSIKGIAMDSNKIVFAMIKQNDSLMIAYYDFTTFQFELHPTTFTISTDAGGASPDVQITDLEFDPTSNSMYISVNFRGNLLENGAPVFTQTVNSDYNARIVKYDLTSNSIVSGIESPLILAEGFNKINDLCVIAEDRYIASGFVVPSSNLTMDFNAFDNASERTLQVSFGQMPFIATYSNQTSLGIETIENQYSFYPNPVNNQLFIQSEKQIQEIKITDVMGRTVYQIKPNTSSFTLNVTDFSNGNYFISVDSQIEKLIIQH